MAFVREPVPTRGVPLDVIEGVRRIVAFNPSVMTYHGTNTFLIDDDEAGITVLDPGPADHAHIAAVLAASSGRIRRILISHSHSDHSGAANALREVSGAPIFAWHGNNNPHFVTDYGLRDGDVVAGLAVIYTPGHAADHICFERSGGVAFTADHVMGWASSIVNPPDGNMANYCDSLEKMLRFDHRIYLCGHGPVLVDPHTHVRSLLEHRLRREREIALAVAAAPANSHDLMERLYSKIDPLLKRAAERNVMAHLIKMENEGKVRPHGNLWHWIEDTIIEQDGHGGEYLLK